MPRLSITKLNLFVLALSLCLSAVCSAGSPEVYFSPNGHIKSRIIQAINDSKTSIDIAVFDFTSRGLKSALEKAKKRGVRIRILTDAKESDYFHSVIPSLIKEGFVVGKATTREQGIMHNKFAVFDGKLLVTGSYNWTESAEHYNYENTVFLSEPTVIKTYEKEFERIWKKAARD